MLRLEEAKSRESFGQRVQSRTGPANRITHWTSPDGEHWTKDTRWSKEGNHDFTGSRPKSSYFDPSVIYDPVSRYWYMFYVAYRCMPDKRYDELRKKANPAPVDLYNGAINHRAQIYRSKTVRPLGPFE